MPYFAQCERIYQLFRADELRLSQQLMELDFFQLEYVPDPYLVISGSRDDLLSDGRNFLHVLTTNPGQGVPFQMRGSPALRATYVETSVGGADRRISRAFRG